MLKNPDTTALSARNPVLQACSEITRRTLFERGQVRTFEHGTLLVGDGDPAMILLFPLQGTLQMGKATARRRKQIICSPTSSSCTGICTLLIGEHSPTEVRGLEPGAVLIVHRADFESLTHQDPVLCRAAWASVADCMAHLSGLVAQLSFQKVAERVTGALLKGTERDGDVVRVTQSELAAQVGTTREVVARCLAGFQAAGMIRLGRGRITVLERNLLRNRT